VLEQHLAGLESCGFNTASVAVPTVVDNWLTSLETNFIDRDTEFT
jgi:hypothetical protein